MVVHERALTKDRAVLTHSAEGICVASGRVIGRRNRDVEVKVLGAAGAYLDRNDVRIFLSGSVGRKGGAAHDGLRELVAPAQATLSDILYILRRTYCGTLAAERRQL